MNTDSTTKNLYYLTAQFPKRFKLYDKVVKRLNDKGIKSNDGYEYNLAIVNNVIRGQTKDNKVRLELIAMLAELGDRSEAVSMHLKAAEELLTE